MLLFLVLVLQKLAHNSTETILDQVCAQMDIQTCRVFQSGSHEIIFMELRQIFTVSGPLPWDLCGFVGVGTYYFGCINLLDHLQDDV